MSLTLAQLLSPPAQASPLGGVSQGSGVYISPEGIISATGATGGFPFGTTMAFYQATAPFGWTQLTSEEFDDASIRIVNSFGGNPGGSLAFSSVFSSYTPTGSIDTSQLKVNAAPVSGSITNSALSTAQIAAHGHTFGSLKEQQYAIDAGSTKKACINQNKPWTVTGKSDNAGSGSGHTHAFNLTASGGTVTGSAAFQGDPRSFAVRYVDFIVARAS
jgi:hypothetical protein